MPTGRDDTVLTFLAPSLPFADDIVDFEVHVDGPGLTLRGWTRSLGGDGLDDFFKGLEADFMGWGGTRSWRSMEGNLTIDAVHAGHDVALLVRVARDYHRDAWSVSIPAVVLPGEDLRRLAEDLEAFFQAALTQRE